MGTTENIIKIQLEKDYYEDIQPDFISGLAQLAVDEGFDSLSDKQKAILEPHLSQSCEGITDPGGYHNDCEVMLEDEALLEAYEQENYYEALLCADCIAETEEHQAQWERFNRD